MANDSDDLPVLVVDGARFADLDGFAREFSQLLCHGTWHGDLDALNDILRGGFGTPEGGWILRWLNSESSRAALGHEAMARFLEAARPRCHPSNREKLDARIAAARRRQGPTLFDDIVKIIHEHGPGGEEYEDGVLLELR
jgi:RNAse (barnase) inhibitor barstar